MGNCLKLTNKSIEHVIKNSLLLEHLDIFQDTNGNRITNICLEAFTENKIYSLKNLIISRKKLDENFDYINNILIIITKTCPLLEFIDLNTYPIHNIIFLSIIKNCKKLKKLTTDIEWEILLKNMSENSMLLESVDDILIK